MCRRNANNGKYFGQRAPPLGRGEGEKNANVKKTFFVYIALTYQQVDKVGTSARNLT